MALVIVALIGMAGWWARSGVPTYQGKDVYYWMFKTQSSSLDDNPGLAAIGTNAVPYLVKALATSPTQFDRHAWLRSQRGQRLFGKMPGFTWTISAKEVRRAAAISLLDFKHEARPALPELLSALTDSTLDESTRQTVLWVLGEIGPPDEAAPSLIQAWTMISNSTPQSMRSVLRHDLVLYIGRMADRHPVECLPILMSELNSGEPELQEASVWGVNSLGRAATQPCRHWSGCLAAPTLIPNLLPLRRSGG